MEKSPYKRSFIIFSKVAYICLAIIIIGLSIVSLYKGTGMTKAQIIMSGLFLIITPIYSYKKIGKFMSFFTIIWGILVLSQWFHL